MDPEVPDRVFDLAAEMFALLSTPTRLRILYALFEGEKNVGELLQRVGVSQPNMSQHLGAMYRAGVLGRRRAGAQVFYCVANAQALLLCEVLSAEQAPGR